MPDYISRNSIYSKIAMLEDIAINRYLNSNEDQKEFALFSMMNERTAFKHMIADEPTANVREDVHGKWNPGNPICPVCGESKFKGLGVDIQADWKPPFCPNCGARMAGGCECTR